MKRTKEGIVGGFLLRLKKPRLESSGDFWDDDDGVEVSLFGDKLSDGGDVNKR